MSDFWEIFNPSFILHNALYGSIAVGIFCPIIGVYFYLRRMTLLGIALPQVSAAGISLAFLLTGLGFGWSLHPGEPNDRFLALFGSLALTTITILILAALDRRRQGTNESRLGALYALAFASAILMVSSNPSGKIELLSLLQGEIVAVSPRDLNILLVTYLALGVVLLVLNRQFLLISFDRESAEVMGKNVFLWDTVLYLLIGATISMGVLIVGPLLTFAFLTIPPLTARRFSRRMGSFLALSVLFGGLSGLFGFYFSYHWDLPLGPTAIAVSGGFLALGYVVKKLMPQN